ncbi:MAG: SRPBCC family protein [Dehalococcoidia bacterium]|nr:SRPBCC family protein [Dehalococcoidia bacterium]
MAAYYTSQAYSAPAAVIWPVLSDFVSWARWFPRVSCVEVAGGRPQGGSELLASGDQPGVWTRWRIGDWRPPHHLRCDHLESSAPMAGQVQAAYLAFELIDDADGCTLEVEIGVDGYGMVGDFFVGVTLGQHVRRMLPELVDAFSDYVVARSANVQTGPT